MTILKSEEGIWTISCDKCDFSETFSGYSSFQDMWKSAKEESNWRCFKDDEGWKHSCNDCRMAYGKQKREEKEEVNKEDDPF